MSRWFRTAFLCWLWTGCGSSALSPDGAAGDGAPLDAALSPDGAAGDGAALDAASPADVAVPLDTARPDLSVPDDLAPTDDGGADAGADRPPSGGMFNEATLTVAPTAYSFPSTLPGEQSTAVRFTITNIGLEASGPISHVIDGSTEFVVTASTCGQPLAYQATCEVGVVFKPIIAGAPKFARLIVSATPGKTFSVLLYGNSPQATLARLDPTTYDFPTTSIGTSPSPMFPLGTFTVTNSGGAAIGPLSAEISGQDAAEFAIATNSCDLLQPGGTCTITVRFRPTTAGAKLATLTVSAPGLTLPAATLSGSGAEPAKLMLTPTTQNFGMIPLGQKSAFSFNVTNEGGVESGKPGVTVLGMNVSEFSVTKDAACDQPLQPGTSCGITVTFAPTIPGTKTASLQAGASPGGFSTASLSATGLSPASGGLTLTSPSPDPFGTVNLGDSSTGFFVVENKGPTQAGKVMTSISGSNSAEFTVTDNSCPNMLEIGGQCPITVRFTPQLSGRRVANLQVTALPGGFATLPMFGTANTQVMLLISPTTRNFGNRAVGNQTGSIQEFQVRVSGSLTTMTGPLSVVTEGADAPNFQIVYNDCQDTTLHPSRTSCRVGVRFVPVSAGQKTSSLAASATPGGTARATMVGNGT